MHAHWNLDDRHRWDAFADGARAGLQQTWAYGQAMQSLGVPCLRVAITQDASPKSPWLAAAQFIVQRLPWFVRFTLCQGGPLWAAGASVQGGENREDKPGDGHEGGHEGGAALQQQALALMRSTLPLRRPRMALFSPAMDALGAESPHVFSKSTRLTTGRSTVLLDLTRPEADRRAAQEGRWRNRLAAAERGALKVRVCGNKRSDYDWLVKAEAAQRKERRYLSLPTGFVEAFQAAHRKPSQALLTLAAELQNQRCAGMTFLVHGTTATYHLGWTDDNGREHSAHNLLMWQACSLLAERGVQQLDLGGVNTVANPGLARFKLGSGGRVVTWAGTYW